MSGDNIIFVQKRIGFWYVWHQQNPEIPEFIREHTSVFGSRADALLGAHDLQRQIGYVEYGVSELEDDPRNRALGGT